MRYFKTAITGLTTLFIFLSTNIVIAEDNLENIPFKTGYINIDGVPGKVKIKGLESYNLLNSWSFGATSSEKKTSFTDFFMEINDENDASIALFKALSKSRTIPTVTVAVTNTIPNKLDKSEIVFKFIMHNVTVSSFNTHYSASEMLTSISLNYESAVYENGKFDKNQKALPENSFSFTVPKNTNYNFVP